MPKQPLKLASPGDMGASCEKCTPVFLVLLSHTQTVSVRSGGKSIRLSTGTHGAKTAHSMALPTLTVKAGTVFRGCLSACRKITCSFRKLSGACMGLGAVCPPVPIILTYPSHQSFPEPILFLPLCLLTGDTFFEHRVSWEGGDSIFSLGKYAEQRRVGGKSSDLRSSLGAFHATKPQP